MIMRLSGELKREKDRILTELASQAAIKRKVIFERLSCFAELWADLIGKHFDERELVAKFSKLGAGLSSVSIILNLIGWRQEIKLQHAA